MPTSTQPDSTAKSNLVVWIEPDWEHCFAPTQPNPSTARQPPLPACVRRGPAWCSLPMLTYDLEWRTSRLMGTSSNLDLGFVSSTYLVSTPYLVSTYCKCGSVLLVMYLHILLLYPLIGLFDKCLLTKCLDHFVVKVTLYWRSSLLQIRILL
jgi:hypothetical protein